MTTRRSALMQLDDVGGAYRGLDDGLELKPISAAVVIGIGGSGIQTISRLRSSTRAQRPDQVAIESLKYIGVDAVDLTSQNPPLPAGVTLETSEFFNVTENPFIASTYIKGHLQSDGYLQQWWDPEYSPPTGPITEGLKRERMLGRLAFHREREALAAKISSALTGCITLANRARSQGGVMNDPPKIPIYIVTSSVGGTGSSGFLEVIFACWQAAEQLGFYPEIRVFVYLPSVFHAEVIRQPGGGVAARAQQANAYAFFREVDHFCRFSSELAGYFGRPPENGGPTIPDGDLIKQIYVIDNQLRGKGSITSITDMYEIVAEAMFHFTLSNVGMPLVGVDATNTDRALAELDAFGKPRRYCGLGIARVVFPGDTFRFHLSMGYIDWFLRNGLLAALPNERETVRNHELMEQVENYLHGLDARSRALNNDDDVDDFLALKEVAMAELERIPEALEAERLIRMVRTQSSMAETSLQETARLRNQALLDSTVAYLNETVFSSGAGIPFAMEVMRQFRKRLQRNVEEAGTDAEQQATGKGEAEAEVNADLKSLYAASRRTTLERVVARGQAIIGQPKTQRDIAAKLGRSIQSWVEGIYAAEEAEARLRFFRALLTSVEEMEDELRGARSRLETLAEDAFRLWEQDSLLGKDAGPAQTTTLLPADAQPEVEECQLMVDILRSVKSDSVTDLTGDSMRDFVRNWMNENANRGFFSLGSKDQNESAAAEQSLVADLRALSMLRALKHADSGGGLVDRLPAGLATLDLGNPSILENAMRGLIDESKSVCWSWDQGRFSLSSSGDGTASLDVVPTVTTTIAHPASLRDAMARLADPQTKLVEIEDHERVVALSCEWAVPVHTLHQMTQWQTSYRSLAEQRSRSAAPPSHIDKRFEDQLTELIPIYFDEEHIGKLIGQALVFSSLLREEDDRILKRYQHSRVEPAQPLLKRNTSGEFVGCVVRVEGDTLTAGQHTVTLGSTWKKCFNALGDNASLQASITSVADWLLRTIGGEELEGIVSAYSQKTLVPQSAAVEREPEEREVIDRVFEGLEDWITHMRAIQL